MVTYNIYVLEWDSSGDLTDMHASDVYGFDLVVL